MKNRPQNKYWLTFGLAALGAALMFLPFLVIDKGYFTYAGDYNSQMVPFQFYANQFLKNGGGSFSWATDLGSGFVNSYAYYLLGSPFFWLSMLFPAGAEPYLMVPMMVLKFALAGAGAQLWMRRWVKNENLAVVGGLLFAFSGFNIYNVFFYFFLDATALFPYLLWALDEAVLKKRKGPFAAMVALCLLDNYFFFAGQVVFLAVYFIAMLSAKSYRIRMSDFGRLALESLLGCGMGCVLAIPALLFLAENPRTVSPFSGYDFLLYRQPQQYAAIVYNMFFPPDSPYMPVVFSKGVIKWTSLSLYLPLVSTCGVWAYLRCKQGTGFKRILYVCLFMAFVPMLNSSFYAFNSSYYARWLYMPILVMCAATVKALEDEDIKLEKGIVPTLLMTFAFCAFAFVPVKGEGKETGWSIGVLTDGEKFWMNLGFAVLGIAVLWLLWLRYERRPQFAKRLCAAVLAFSCVMGVTHIAIGKFPQWEKDKTMRQDLYVDARTLSEKLPQGAYRTDSYECFDNMGIWMDKSCMACFHSTVAPAVMEFYPQFGVKRDVRSEPDLEKQALRSLLGVRFTVCPEEHAAEFEEKAGENWQRWGQEGRLVVYENQNALPLVCGYDYYVTREDFDALSETRREEMLLRAIVLEEDQLQEWGSLLSPLSETGASSFTEERKQRDLETRRAMSAGDAVEFTRSGLTAHITLDRERIVQLAVPHDKGFTAWVNGAEVPVLRVSGGLTAIPVPEGENDIRLEYHTPGLKIAFIIAGISLLCYAAYLAAGIKSSRKKSEVEKRR